MDCVVHGVTKSQTRRELTFTFSENLPHSSGNSIPRCESESEVTQLCPTLCDPTDCSLPGSSIQGWHPVSRTAGGRFIV